VRIEAEFTGTTGLGYHHGQRYVLQVLVDRVIRKNAYPIYDDQPRIVASMPPAQPCPYASWQAFWKNWKKPT
jgi:hypothetical protein